MKNRAFSGKIGWGFLFIVFLLPACSSKTPSVTYYALNTLPAMQQENPGVVSGEEITIGVGPVDFPEFLDRPQIVTRKGQNQVEISEFHRWAGSLQGDFSRVLAKNITILLPTSRVVIYPWAEQFSPTYRVKLDVEQFDGILGEHVFLNVTWSVTGQEGSNELMVKNTLIKESVSAMEEPVSAKDYEALVAAKSRVLEKLGLDIASALKNLRHQDSGS
jgi:uncharacterized lipoprotein YmbA